MSSTPFIVLSLAFVTLAVLAAWAIRAESLEQRPADTDRADPRDDTDGAPARRGLDR